jgi:hypothetical protein
VPQSGEVREVLELEVKSASVNWQHKFAVAEGCCDFDGAAKGFDIRRESGDP